MTNAMPEHAAANSMLIFHSEWEGKPTFSLLPLLLHDAPFIEAIYLPEEGQLAVVSPQHKPGLAMLARLDDAGNPKPITGSRAKPGEVQLHRVAVEKYYEYTVRNPDDIRTIVELVAQNPEHQAFRNFFSGSLGDEAPANNKFTFFPGGLSGEHRPAVQLNAEAFESAPGTSHTEA